MTKLQAKNNSTGRTSFRILQKTQQVDFELILASFCVKFWVTIRNLLGFSIEVSIFFPIISSSLNPGDHDPTKSF